MTGGRELDALIAEHCLNHKVMRDEAGGIEEHTSEGTVRPLKPYCTDISAAWEVVEKMSISILPIKGGSWFALVGSKEGWETPAEFLTYLQEADFVKAGAAVEKTAPLTICLAALKAVEKRATVLTDDTVSRTAH